ncbi:protein suppressor of sable isoform X3 [Pectinophora gossypiella]|uniref:protein suppressor of sable isoform X3 n=1 Tax=Pectinophora gossypiella TaxID=13191 RepID=UPI00214DF614|nr:protein suppressor of sable isoform X3 [Pectinophora gossypiella]
MLIVSTNISETFTMAESATNIDDLEDGEIESDGEDAVEAQNENKKEDITVPEEKPQEQQQDHYYSKSGKKKKSKSKGEQKFKDKNKKNRKYSNLHEDDFAGNIEKAIRKAMNKSDEGDVHHDDGFDDRRKHKKRKKYDGKDGPGKKRKKQEYSEEMDESEMMCIRGASPVQRHSPSEMYPEDEKDSYASDSSADSRNREQHHRPQRHRPQQRDRNKNNKNEWRRGGGSHPMQDPDGVCLYYMQGKCHKGGNAISTNVLCIKNLTGVLTPRQISDLTKMGIETLDQLGQLTVLQLNSIGISLKQITEIQMNTMSIQKLGLINANNEQQPLISTPTGSKDLDLRVPPPAVTMSSNAALSSELPGQDIDMRFQPSVTLPISEESSSNKVIKHDSHPNRDMIDIDQYTKDALKFAIKDKENIDISNETFDNDTKSLISNETKDVDHRVLPFSDEPKTAVPINDNNSVKKECDTDIRFLQPEPIFKSPDKRHRRSTTDDDEESNLLIDEKWYSSDEEKGSKRKSPVSSPRPASMSPQQPVPPIIEPSSVLSKLGDLSKIDISEEVTKLLNTMKNNLHENKSETISEPTDPRKSRDPRSKRSPDKVSDSTKVINKKPRVSIYECIEGEPTDGRRRTDVDLRKPEFPAFGDTDLRQSTSGDIDFRLGLPFKAIPNYTPASEINGSINSHPPIPYKLFPIEIPRPDYTDIRNSTAKSQALLDPRLRKVFRLSVDESNSDSEKPSKPVSTGPRVDPRRKQTENDSLDQKSPPLDIQTILQNSNWFKELSSTQKISVNQHLMPVMQMIKQHLQEKSSGKKFDLTAIQSNTVLCSIFTNLGVSLGDNGEFSYLPKPKEALLKTPISYSQSPFGMDANNMNMMNMPSMGVPSVGGMNNMNVGNMHGYNQSMPDPRGGPTPGLLGIAPNIPHNFNNFGPNNFGNMGFNGPNPGNNFNYMDGEQNMQRFPNRGGHRGRGNDRWNRGGSGRGHRDRKNFNDRGNWKNERH